MCGYCGLVGSIPSTSRPIQTSTETNLAIEGTTGDCWCGFFNDSTAALFLVRIDTRLQLPGMCLSTYAMAANAPEYGLCSALGPRVNEKVLRHIPSCVATEA